MCGLELWDAETCFELTEEFLRLPNEVLAGFSVLLIADVVGKEQAVATQKNYTRDGRLVGGSLKI